MPSRHPAGRAFVALLFAASIVLAALPQPSLALEPPQPLPGYTPAFVSEREYGEWDDCTWAAAEMLLDKWTNGKTIVDRRKLRALSGDTEGGSSLIDVEKAFAKLGFALHTSPKGGGSVTWPQLLDRLKRGGGAILLGDYGKLPRISGRWDRGFWAGEGRNDDHALYLDRYDPKRQRVFVMDPLAPRGWTGEWMRLSSLKNYAWRTPSGKLWVALTPAALAGPFEGVALGDPVASADSSVLRVSWPIDRAPSGWTFSGADVDVEIAPVTEAARGGIASAVSSAAATSRTRWATGSPATGASDPMDLLDPIVRALPAGSELAVDAARAAAARASEDGATAIAVLAPASPTMAVVPSTSPRGSLQASIPLPSTPGIYRVSLTVTDQRTGDQVATAGPLNLYVPGDRAATYEVADHLSAEPGSLQSLSVLIRNIGRAGWGGMALVRDARGEVLIPRNTRIVGTWVAPLLDIIDGDAATLIPDPIDLGPIAYGSGDGQLVDALVRMPTSVGTWRLVLDLTDDALGSFARTGSAPIVIVIEVHNPGDSSGLQ